MAYPNIEAILEEGGNITVGRLAPIECVASASTSYDCPVMLVRREGESFLALLRRLLAEHPLGAVPDHPLPGVRIELPPPAAGILDPQLRHHRLVLLG